MPAKTKQTTPSQVVFTMTNPGVLASFVTTKIESSVALAEKTGIRLHQVEYFLFNAPLTSWAASADALAFGLSFLGTQPVGGFMPVSPGVIDYNCVTRLDLGAAATGSLIKDPIVKNFHEQYPEGILVHPANLYWWTNCVNAMGGITGLYGRLSYTYEDISQEMWDDLWKQMFVTQAG